VVSERFGGFFAALRDKADAVLLGPRLRMTI
jgi:hypothetical protein